MTASKLEYLKLLIYHLKSGNKVISDSTNCFVAEIVEKSLGSTGTVNIRLEGKTQFFSVSIWTLTRI